jgi:hypothetical protein
MLPSSKMTRVATMLVLPDFGDSFAERGFGEVGKVEIVDSVEQWTTEVY